MTQTRGRVLIINNRNGTVIREGRTEMDWVGSDIDYKNVNLMFEQFGFVVSKLSRDNDWTAQVI